MPESDDPGGEIDDVDEFLREFDNVERDETLLELLGEGYDVNAPGDQAVADLLGAWRDDVTAVPVDESRLPSAHTVDGRMPPAPITGGSMSFSDEAEQLRAVASSREFPIALIQQASQSFDDMFAQCSQILGAQSQHTQTVGGAIEAAKAALQSALEAAKYVEKTIHDAADGHARG